MEVENLREELSNERSSARIREENLLSLQKEKSLLESELRQTIQRHEKESAVKNSIINAVIIRKKI